MSLSANNSWPLVLNDLDWFIQNGDGKKMYFDEVSGRRLHTWDFKADAHG